MSSASNDLKTSAGPVFAGKYWSEEENKQLYKLVIENKTFDWDKLAFLLKTSEEQVKWQWQRIIYPRIKSGERIAGSRKWSQEEDLILLNFDKIRPQQFQEISIFLPDRSVYSIQARRKRIDTKYLPVQQEQTSQLGQIDGAAQEQLLPAYDYRKKVIEDMAEKYRKRMGQQQQTAQL